MCYRIFIFPLGQIKRMLEKEGEKGVGNSGECLESEENGEQVVRVEDEL